MFPEMFPSVPLLCNRNIDLALPNPFSEDATGRHPEDRGIKILPDDGKVDGYIKFRIRPTSMPTDDNGTLSHKFTQKSLGLHRQSLPNIPGVNNIPFVPPDFGRGYKLDSTDNKLFKFCNFSPLFLDIEPLLTKSSDQVGFCEGRTLLPKSNFWLVDIAPMASGNECVKHAILAFAAAYVLDYQPLLRDRANYHYRKAVGLLTEALQSPDSRDIGKDDGTVAALILLLSDDVCPLPVTYFLV